MKFYNIFEWNSTQILENFKLWSPFDVSQHGLGIQKFAPLTPPPKKSCLRHLWYKLMLYTLIPRNIVIILKFITFFKWNLTQFLQKKSNLGGSVPRPPYDSGPLVGIYKLAPPPRKKILTKPLVRGAKLNETLKFFENLHDRNLIFDTF